MSIYQCELKQVTHDRPDTVPILDAHDPMQPNNRSCIQPRLYKLQCVNMLDVRGEPGPPTLRQ